jgi:predicted nucleic acid-binding protein
VITGLDTNILCYALDPAFLEHEKLKNLLINLSSENRVAINPTVLHETYHTLVFGQKWVSSEAERRLKMLLKHPYIEFLSQTKRTCIVALSLAPQYKLGGRDALIIANFITNKIPAIYTHDQELLTHTEILWKDFKITFKDPLIET